MKKTYLPIYVLLLIVMIWQTMSSLYLISTTVSHGSQIAQLKLQQLQLSLEKQQLQQQLANQSAIQNHVSAISSDYVDMYNVVTIDQVSDIALNSR